MSGRPWRLSRPRAKIPDINLTQQIFEGTGLLKYYARAA
jgi:hypothetical protein